MHATSLQQVSLLLHPSVKYCETVYMLEIITVFYVYPTLTFRVTLTLFYMVLVLKLSSYSLEVCVVTVPGLTVENYSV